MIDFNDVTFLYTSETDDSITAVLNSSFTVLNGEIVLLCGVSGCGKSTLCRIINGLIPNYYKGNLCGEVSINNVATADLDMVDRAKFIGSVFQNPKTQFFNTDVESEIAFTSENLGVEPSEINIRVEKQLTNFHLQDFRYRNLNEMSGGEKQRVACAAATSTGQDLIVLDEPSSNLDYKSIEELKRLLRMWKKQGKTVVISEHRLYFLKDLADKVIVIDKAKITDILTIDKFKELSDKERKDKGLRSLVPFKTQLSDAKNLPNNIIELKNINFAYRKNTVLSISNYTVNFSGVCAIVGHNGAGKSALVNILCGLLKAKDSVIKINDKNNNRKQLQKACFMVAQDVNHQFFSDSVIEELRSINGVAEEDIDKVLKELNLYYKRDLHPMALSGGEKQRLAIALAFLIDRQIIFFDEPTSGLDYRHMIITAELLNKLSYEGKSVFVVTHDVEYILSSCKHLLMMSGGKIIGDMSITEENREKIEKYYSSL